MSPSANPDEQPLPAMDGSPRRRLTAGERRTAIVNAARAEFARSGFQGASTARIAASACCSEPMLYKHFSGKLALFIAVLVEVSATMEAQIDAVLAADDPVQRWIDFLPAAMTSDLYAEMVGLRKLAVTLCDEPSVRSILADSTDRLRGRVHEAVERGKAAGTIRSDVDPEYVAWLWLGITLAASYRNSIEGDGGFGELLPHAVTFIRGLTPG